MILYAPIIEPSIPAFSGSTLKVNFQHNIAVGNDIGGIVATIKNYNSNEILNSITIEANTVDYVKGLAEFYLPKQLELIAGNFYKVQIAYQDLSLENFGPYSTVGITRWLGNNDTIELKVAGLKDNAPEDVLNPNLIEYNGTYKYNINGLSEPVYQYKFELLKKDKKNNSELIETSDWLLPKRDSNNEPIMKYILQNDLEYFVNYILRFTVLTVNGYTGIKEYQIAKRGLYPNQFTGKLIVTQEPEAKENGYVHIYITQDATLADGVFRLIRREEYSDIWDELTRFNMAADDSVNQFSWKDYSVEHGKKYYYAIQQYGLDTSQQDSSIPYYSTIEEVPINEVQFEHMYLGDDKYQLKLAFNPQVSSFKETVLESKTDVIGGKYPFFFRNGNVRYKEIPISGLLSYFLDDEGCFLNTLNTLPASIDNEGHFMRTTNLVNHNFASERQFKLAVLDWLNNGKPKLFRSPAEGNYVLRLMNISMSPNQQLGRMLHTISATGYEAMEASPSKMLEQKIMSFQTINSKFKGTANDYGAIIAQGKYLLKGTEIPGDDIPLENLIQLCAIQIIANEKDIPENLVDKITRTLTIHYSDDTKESFTLAKGEIKTISFNKIQASIPASITFNGNYLVGYNIYGYYT